MSAHLVLHFVVNADGVPIFSDLGIYSESYPTVVDRPRGTIQLHGPSEPTNDFSDARAELIDRIRREPEWRWVLRHLRHEEDEPAFRLPRHCTDPALTALESEINSLRVRLARLEDK